MWTRAEFIPTINIPSYSEYKLRLECEGMSSYLKKKRLKIFEQMVERAKEAMVLREQALKSDPFYFYEPVDGDIGIEAQEFLKEFLKEEDIPSKLDSAADVHGSEASIRGASGGNQSSKTTLGCIEGLIAATGALPLMFDKGSKFYKYKIPSKRLSMPRPCHVRVIGEDYQNGILRNLIPTYRKWSPRDYLFNRSWEQSYSAGEQVIRYFKPGTKDLVGSIEFMSNKQDLGTFQGPPRHKLILDEEPLHEVYKENLMRFTTASDLDILFCMTPTKGLSWTYDLYTRGEDESGHKVDWYQISSVCNPYANLKVLREILKEMPSYDEVKMRLLGEFISLSGLVYGKLFNSHIHVIEPFETGCNCGGSKLHNTGCPFTKYVCFMGIDAHMVKDSCAVLAAYDQADNVIVDTCYKKPVDTDKFKSDLAFLTHNKRVAWTVFDPSNDSDLTIFKAKNIFWDMTHGEDRIKSGFCGDKRPGSIASGVDTIKRRLKPNSITGSPTLYIMNRPENQLLIKSFKTLQRDAWFNEDVKGQRDKIQEGIHDHHAALRYILQNRLSWQPHQEQTYEPEFSDSEVMVA